jgi:hypothetical protein
VKACKTAARTRCSERMSTRGQARRRDKRTFYDTDARVDYGLGAKRGHRHRRRPGLRTQVPRRATACGTQSKATFGAEFRGESREPIRPAPRTNAACNPDHKERIEGDTVPPRLFAFRSNASRACARLDHECRCLGKCRVRVRKLTRRAVPCFCLIIPFFCPCRPPGEWVEVTPSGHGPV